MNSYALFQFFSTEFFVHNDGGHGSEHGPGFPPMGQVEQAKISSVDEVIHDFACECASVLRYLFKHNKQQSVSISLRLLAGMVLGSTSVPSLPCAQNLSWHGWLLGMRGESWPTMFIACA